MYIKLQHEFSKYFHKKLISVFEMIEVWLPLTSKSSISVQIHSNITCCHPTIIRLFLSTAKLQLTIFKFKSLPLQLPLSRSSLIGWHKSPHQWLTHSNLKLLSSRILLLRKQTTSLGADYQWMPLQIFLKKLCTASESVVYCWTGCSLGVVRKLSLLSFSWYCL